jgi:hypothetical protein
MTTTAGCGRALILATLIALQAGCYGSTGSELATGPSPAFDRRIEATHVEAPDGEASQPAEDSETHESPTGDINQQPVHTGGSCFMARPAPRCDSTWFFQYGASRYMGGGENAGGDYIWSADLGYMINISRRSAVGGSFFGAVGEYGEWAGLKVRYRRWLSGAFSVDLALGAAPLTSEHIGRTIWVAEAGINAGDLLSVTAGLHTLHRYHPYTGQSSKLAPTIGLRVGSYPAVLMTALTLVAGAIVAATWDGPFGS